MQYERISVDFSEIRSFKWKLKCCKKNESSGKSALKTVNTASDNYITDNSNFHYFIPYLSILVRNVEGGMPRIAAAFDLLFLLFSRAHFIDSISISERN